jgi:hypothetical protein
MGKKGLSSGSEAKDAACPAYTASSLLTPRESMCQTRRKTPGIATASANSHHVDNSLLVNLAARRSTRAAGSAGSRESSSTSDATARPPPTRQVAPARRVQ